MSIVGQHFPFRNAREKEIMRDSKIVVTRVEAERILIEKKLCTKEKFRTNCTKGYWETRKWKTCYSAILNAFSIDIEGNNVRDLVNFLNKGKAWREFPCKRPTVDHSMVESSDEEEVEAGSHDVSMSSVLSKDEDPEVLALKRHVTEQNKELKSKF